MRERAIRCDARATHEDRSILGPERSHRLHPVERSADTAQRDTIGSPGSSGPALMTGVMSIIRRLRGERLRPADPVTRRARQQVARSPRHPSGVRARRLSPEARESRRRPAQPPLSSFSSQRSVARSRPLVRRRPAGTRRARTSITPRTANRKRHTQLMRRRPSGFPVRSLPYRILYCAGITAAPSADSRPGRSPPGSAILRGMPPRPPPSAATRNERGARSRSPRAG